MEFKDGAPEGEIPPIHCPVCLEAWDTEERLPKFLTCHHSVCVTCAGRLQRPAPQAPSGRRSGQSPSTPTSPLARLIANRVSTVSVSEPTKCEETFVVRCPLCRTSTPVQDPATLQTNFYLWGLLRAPSLPRLVLWCESCSRVASPDCTDHNLRPFPEKLRLLQEELVERANDAKKWTQGRAGEYRRQVEVYRWLCGLLRHAHGRVLDSLTHAQHTHRRLHHHNQDIQALVKRGEALQKSQDPEEQVVEQLMRAVEEVDERHRAVTEEADFVELLQKFPVMSTHKGPRGYAQARVLLEANESVLLSFCGEEECLNDSVDSGRGNGAKDGGRSVRSSSLSDGSRRRASSRQMVRSRSLLHTKGKSEHLLDPGDASDHLTSRASTPTSRRSALGVFDSDVYEEETSLSVHRQAISTPQPPPSKKKSLVNNELDSSPADSHSYQDNVGRRRRMSEDDYLRSQRQRAPRGGGGGGPRRRRPADRENRPPAGRRRGVQSLCSLM